MKKKEKISSENEKMAEQKSLIRRAKEGFRQLGLDDEQATMRAERLVTGRYGYKNMKELDMYFDKMMENKKMTNFAKGGMAKKPRTGHTDYRKGGMVYSKK